MIRTLQGAEKFRAEDPEPGARTVHCDAPLDLGDRAVWAAQAAVMWAALRMDPIVAAAGPVDLVIGDDYVTQLATWFDAASLVLPRPGWSATAVRADLAGCWHRQRVGEPPPGCVATIPGRSHPSR